MVKTNKVTKTIQLFPKNPASQLPVVSLQDRAALGSTLLSMPAFLGFSLSPAASGRGEGPAAAAVGGGSSKAVAADFFKAFETSDSTASAATAGRFNCFVFLAGGSPLLEGGRFNFGGWFFHSWFVTLRLWSRKKF